MIELEDLKSWYENNKDLPPHHEASLKPTNDKYPMANNCLTMILGATGSGKSYVLKDIFDRLNYDVIFLISPTTSFDQTKEDRPMQCKYIFNYDNPEYGISKLYEYKIRGLELEKKVAELNDMMYRRNHHGIVSDFDIEEVVKEIDELTTGLDAEIFNTEFKVAVVTDDCGYMNNQMKNKDTALNKLAMLRRHMFISVFLLVQSYVQIGKDIRRQCTDLILTKKTPNEDIKALYHQLPNLPYKDIISQPRYFSALVEGLTKDNEYGTVQFLYGGLYYNFKKVSREDVIKIIRNYEQLRRDMRAKIE